MKKSLSLILIMLLLFCAAFTMTGCVNLSADQYEDDMGITMMLSSDGEEYFAQFLVITYDYSLNTSLNEADNYFYALLDTEYLVERVQDYPASVSGKSYFMYTATLSEEQWLLTDTLKIKEGFLNIKVSYDFLNPFALCFDSGNSLSNIYSTLKQGNSALGLKDLEYYLDNTDIDFVQTKLLIPTRSTSSAKNGSIVLMQNSGQYFYQLKDALFSTQNPNSPSNRVSYSFTAMASYGWFSVAIIIGLITVLLVILLAKKRDGVMIDISKPKYNSALPNYYMVNNAKQNLPDPFNPEENSNNNSSSDNIFDGF